jgi:U3 small nucleolar RNA-associated protein 14
MSKKHDRTPKLAEDINSSDDEEIDEDLAFNSDDERQYGSLFSKKHASHKLKRKKHEEEEDSDEEDEETDDVSDESEDSNDNDDDDSDDGIASDDDMEDGDGGQYMLDLLNSLDNKTSNNHSQEDIDRANANILHSTLIKESPFSSTAIKSSNLTLDQLLNDITDTEGFASVKKVMRDINRTSDPILDNRPNSNVLSTTKAPVDKYTSDRIERKVNYKDQSEEVSAWTDIVKKNREAETLDFRLNTKDQVRITKDELIGKFEPTTDFEKEIALALEEAGVADEKVMLDREERELLGLARDENGDFMDDDLGRNTLSIEELQKRRGELAKMRALLFYEEQKRHHINKIKSKKYRKIRKKHKMKLQETEDEQAAAEDEEIAKEMEEKAEMERMKERMNLKHKNTSKWAKRVLRRGGNVDIETRRALSEQIRIGDDLRKKMIGSMNDSDESGDEDENLIAEAQSILVEAEKDIDTGDARKNSLLKLAFMKKGLEAQRERAKQEARQLLHELQANESEDDEIDHDQSSLPDVANENKPKEIASAKEMKRVLPEGKLVASSLLFGNSNEVKMSGSLNIHMDENEESKSDHIKSNTLVEKDSTSQIILSKDNTSTGKLEESVKNDISKPRTMSKNISQKENSKKTTVDNNENPWLNSYEDPSISNPTKSSKLRKGSSGITKEGIIDMKGVANAVSITDDSENTNDHDKLREAPEKVTQKKKNDSHNIQVADMSQEELVRRAFAAPSDKDIEEEFNKEKDEMRDRDDYSKKKKEEENKSLVSGWGSWAGDGVIPRPPPKAPKRMQAPKKQEIPKRKREDDHKKNVIINAKRVKKTAKFQLDNIPYPYSSREQYDRAMSGALGVEWNVSGAVKDMTRRDVLTRAGKIIKPLDKKAKTKRAPAKF